ncbi:dynein regulatory complex protein 11-like [Ischnura elegans]|uniref:dynein regulatory complex protein 11-like n=1 Tax=Ischnura elegans TaxID=197161 RepID=UPI001ED8A398|nr:dynein regulatory complex protein 11-like [Ischnura elegans]
MERTGTFFYCKEYHKLWEKSQEELKLITKYESVLLKEKVLKDRDTALNIMGCIYLQYIRAVNKLDECFDQIVQPQKRILIRSVMDSCLCRILELKHNIVEIDMSDFTYIDCLDGEYPVMLHDGEMNIPRYFIQDRRYEVEERKANLKRVLKKLGCYEKVQKPMTLIQAVLIIQTHERARQGRLRYEFMNEIRKLREKGKQVTSESDDQGTLTNAAITIQKIWRGYKCRKLFNKRKLTEMMLIGMSAFHRSTSSLLPPVSLPSSGQPPSIQPPSIWPPSNRPLSIYPPSKSQIPQASYRDPAQKRAEEISKRRHQIQAYHDVRYKQVVPGEKVRLLLRKGKILKKKYITQIREWYFKERKEKKKFPDLPSKEKGGSAAIFGMKPKKRSSSKSPKPPKVKKEKGKKSKAKEKGKDSNQGGIKLRPSRFRTEIMAGINEFQKVWMNKNESSNFHQTHDMEMITKEKMKSVKKEVRATVDSLMRLELTRMKAAIERDRAQRRKKGKKGKRGGGSSKGHRGRKGGKKVRRKREKDLTPDRTLDSLFEELVSNGIIKNYPEVAISSFLGDASFVARQWQDMGKKAEPTLGDVRRLIKEYCIIPLGSEYIHNNAPFVRSLLIAGPHGSGKHMILHGICTELGAYLFDISNETIADKYPGKTGLTMLIHLVNKVSRLLQPAIIYMENAEKTFLKRVPKTDTSDPKRLKKELPKLVKGIGPEDRIMVIGLSSCPWESDQKSLASAYNKFIILPRPDYATMSMVWNETLYGYNALNRQFDCMTMARMCDGFTIGVVLKIIQEVLSCKRLLTLKVRPLKHIEFFKLLSGHDPVYAEEEDAFIQWFAKCPLARKKQKYLETIEAVSNKEKKKSKKNEED